MQKLNLTNLEKSDIKYTISRFPDGEIQITLEEFSRKDSIEVHCRITNTEELFILMQVADILNRHGVRWCLYIYYLMGMRMDRVMDFNRPFTLKIISDFIKNIGSVSTDILEPHSIRSTQLSDSFTMDLTYDNKSYSQLDPNYYKTYENYQVVYPDKGASERYGRSRIAVKANKVRNPETGQIESIEITNPELFKDNNKPLMVVDDLCDAGGTFVGLAKEIRKYTDKELNIFVTHMVNRKGIENLSKAYNHVYFTNSYKDWDNLPENVTQIDII